MNRDMKTWNFEYNNDEKVRSVLSRSKNVEIILYDKKREVKVGDEAVLVFDNEKQACVTRVSSVLITEFKKIKDEYEDTNFDDEDLVMVVQFEVVENLVDTRLNLARKIVLANQDIFSDDASILEVDAGFNNSIFAIDGKYIIKVCGNRDKEKLFDVEVNYYQENEASDVIPKLYRYDNSKKVVPYVYEIIECVKGQSVYYHWYKMSELERETFIKKLMMLIRDIHRVSYPSFDWVSYIKDEVLSSLDNSADLLTDDEYQMVLKSLDYYDIILRDNHFTLIHNDLHFDNILISDDGDIKLIDFNDAMIAPFDFDLRIFYMSVEQPWKWANAEMDPYQLPEDYAHLFEYVKVLSGVK